MKKTDLILKRIAPFLGAGALLQAGGCTVDFGESTATLLGLMFQRLVVDVVFGAFNLSTGSMGF
ncbi:MAG: hypothetical protein JSU63_19340 [Phycisphaerales bacterium]|nr:MAG: hypothetical protein JSU63_19340 [Phycisphaerales bacterium]